MDPNNTSDRMWTIREVTLRKAELPGLSNCLTSPMGRVRYCILMPTFSAASRCLISMRMPRQQPYKYPEKEMRRGRKVSAPTKLSSWNGQNCLSHGQYWALSRLWWAIPMNKKEAKQVAGCPSRLYDVQKIKPIKFPDTAIASGGETHAPTTGQNFSTQFGSGTFLFFRILAFFKYLCYYATPKFMNLPKYLVNSLSQWRPKEKQQKVCEAAYLRS